MVLPLLRSDLLTIMQAVTEQRLADVKVEFSEESACCVVVASGGYPESYEKGKVITIGALEGKTDIFIAGAKLEEGRLKTSGGRVLGVTSVAGTLEEAIRLAYANVGKVAFEKAYFRKDIGRKALEVERN